MNSGPAQIHASLHVPPVSKGRHAAIFAANMSLLALLGWVDYATGYELGFFVFYSLPVGLTAWHVGKWPAAVVALGASVAWWLADRFNGQSSSSRFYFLWNLAIHFSAFVINAVTIARIKRDVDERHQLLADLQALRSARPPGGPAVCPACGHEIAGASVTGN